MKKPARKKSNNRRTIPRDYPWKVLSAIVDDCQNEDDSEAVQQVYKDLRGVIRNRNVSGYIDICDKLSLTTVNGQYLTASYESDSTQFTKDVESIRKIRLLTCFSKFQFDPTPFDQKATAYANFMKAEALCRQTNLDPIWSEFSDLDFSGKTIDDIFVSPVLREAKEFISNLLGPCDINRVLDGSKHGPGATADKRGKDSIPIEKYAAPIGVTPGASDLFCMYLCTEDRWLRSLLGQFHATKGPNTLLERNLSYFDFYGSFVKKEVEGSRIMFVAKDSTKYRTICAEPTANVFLQLAVDRYIRRKLRNKGIDLNSQQKNQRLARFGSLFNELITLDLSMASDTVALKLLTLFPDDWREFLLMLRTPVGIFEDNERVNFEKLSSMGNGYTFVIESLIFTALLHGVLKLRGTDLNKEIKDIAVYGDDIILHRRYYSDYAYILRRCGFRVNSKKSFCHGPVRESCGEDFFIGAKVSRPTIKTQPSSTWELHIDHNRFFVWSNTYGIPLSRTLGLIKTWIPTHCFGPVCDDLVGWLFAHEPDTQPDYLCKEATDWQTGIFKLKKLTVSSLSAKPTKHSEFFIPMVFLRNKNRVWWEQLEGFSIPSHGNDNTEAASFSFSKIERKVRTSVFVIPEHLWNPQALNNVCIWLPPRKS